MRAALRPADRPVPRLALASLAVTVFCASTHAQTLLETLDGAQIDDVYGSALATAGDANGDGVGDLLVGSPAYDGARGRAELRSGRDGAPIVTFIGGSPGQRVGHAVSTAGDMNNDGYVEIAFSAVGQSTFDSGVTSYDPVSIWDVEHASDLHTYWSLFNDDTGWSLSGGGDSDGDGLPELLMGAPRYDAGALVDVGRVLRLRYTATSISVSSVAQGDQAGQQMGFDLAWIGNVNGAGPDEFVVGSPYRDEIGLPGQPDVGRVHVFDGLGNLVWTTKGPVQAGGLFGWSVGGGVDLTGNGLPDVLVGAPYYGSGDAGRVALYRGYDGVAQTARVGDDDGDHFGWDVTTVRVDGQPFALVGAPGDGETSGFTLLEPGVVHRCSPADLSTVWSVKGGVSWGSLGSAVAVLGDVNLDGSDEWAASQPFPNVIQTDEVGAVEIYDGKGHTAGWATIGSGLAGTHGVPQLLPNLDPHLGATLLVHLDNAEQAATTAVLFLGLTEVALPFKGGTLHVDPLLSVAFALPAAGVSLPFGVPHDDTLSGFHLLLQGAHADPGAPLGVAISPALDLEFGA
ncbi:MAG: FG-GAP repeat protein [Planctomycetes bacterium]|nr:FG-GAP repeat protein [Planctomycetota bacterium]